MTIHQLKTDPIVFNDVADENKNFEIRFNDRKFQIYDTLILLETKFTGEEMKNGKPLEFTGESITATVKYIMYGEMYGLKEGWVIMSLGNLM